MTLIQWIKRKKIFDCMIYNLDRLLERYVKEEIYCDEYIKTRNRIILNFTERLMKGSDEKCRMKKK